MKNFFKRSAVVLPALLIGSVATLGFYAHASTTPVKASVSVSAEHVTGAVDTDTIQSGSQGVDVKGTEGAGTEVKGAEKADTAESAIETPEASAKGAADPAGGPNDQVQVGGADGAGAQK